MIDMIAYYVIMDSKTFEDRFYAKIQLEKTPDGPKLTKFSKIPNLALLGNFANSKDLCDQINEISIDVRMETILMLMIFAVLLCYKQLQKGCD